VSVREKYRWLAVGVDGAHDRVSDPVDLEIGEVGVVVDDGL